MEGSWECPLIKEATLVSQQGVILQPEDWTWS
jgi:hypothetical protein